MPEPLMPEAGSVVFHARCAPALLADDYELRVGQEMYASGTTTRLDASAQLPLRPAQVYPFRVDGPRFTMDASLIHGVFPPTNGRGSYVKRLPMIVLRRRTLPWERLITRTEERLDTPWMAVLLFEEPEVTTLSPCTVGHVLDTKGLPHMFAPQLSDVDAATRAQPCIGIELPLALFRDIAPMVDEVALLSHVRQVNTEDKELMGLDDDGWFAVVVGNRIPAPGVKYTACLVSLEGVEHLLPTPTEARVLTAADLRRAPEADFSDIATSHMRNARISDPAFPPEQVRASLLESMTKSGNKYAHLSSDPDTSPTSSISSVSQTTGKAWKQIGREDRHMPRVYFEEPTLRLFCLAQWKFECLQGGDFEGIMQSLPDNGGVSVLGMPPALAQAPGGTPSTGWAAALDTGHVPLENLTRDGERTIAWYRGPLTPVAITRRAEGPFHTADQARRLDPVTGLENLGYAAGFEVGRLLALGDPRFALDLLRWRRSDRMMVDVSLTFDLLNRYATTLMRDIRLERSLLTRMPSFLTTAGNVRFGNVMRRTGVTGLGVLRDPSGLRDVRDRLPGLSPAAISIARGFDIVAARALVDGIEVGGGLLLETLGIGSLVERESNLDLLTVDPSLHFAPLTDAFNGNMRELTRKLRP